MSLSTNIKERISPVTQSMLLDLDDISCPISHQIFYDPVMANDGITYEADEIKAWMKKSNLSPVTNKPITNLTPNYFVKTVVDKYLASNPSATSSIYKPNRPHENYLDAVSKIIENGNYNELLLYDKFQLDKFYETKKMEDLLRSNNIVVIKYIIDNALDLDVGNNWRLIHYTLRYASNEIQKYVIDKKINLETETMDGLRPMHIALKYSTAEIQKHLISKGVNLNFKTINNQRAIHIALQYSTPEIQKIIIKKSAYRESCVDKQQRPIHIACQYATPLIVKYLIKKKVDLEATDEHKWTPLHYACRYAPYDTIRYLIIKKVSMTNLTVDGYPAISFIALNDKLSKEEKIEVFTFMLNKN